jgi:hypothetical protein
MSIKAPIKTTTIATMLTTIDNPFDPFEQFIEWSAFDEAKGYYTCAYLARIVKTSNELSEEDESIAIEQAINEIIELNILGIYKRVSKEM